MRFLLLWFIGILLYRVFINDTDTAIYGIVIPLIVCLLCVTLINLLSSKNRVIVAYLFFFLTSTLTLLGIINPLTGSVTDSSNAVLFGFSFYTLSLAYLAKRGVSQGLVTSFKVANPVLLATGPIVLYISKLGHRDILFRVNYYLPFFIVGFFFFFIIGVPLAPLFQLIYSTDVISVILFALIFELFLYANFCGLSLMIYGFFGILGFKIPLNFKQPFTCNNIIDFWRGWHLSLTAVLKSLFYSPLRGRYPSSIALLAVFLASAMWHGVTLNFLIWGIFHTLIFLGTIYSLRQNFAFVPTILFVLAIILGRTIFAEKNIDVLAEKLLFSYQGLGSLYEIMSLPPTTQAALMLGCGVVGIEFFFRNTRMIRKRNYKHLRTPLSISIILMVTIFLISSGGQNFAVYGQR